MSKYRHVLERVLLVSCLMLCTLYAVQTVTAQNVTQGYASDETLQRGMIVRLAKDDGKKVVALDQKHEKEMLGVTVSPADAPVSLSQTNAPGQVFVATYGKYDLLVSTQNGPIKTGDLVTLSSIAGIGMKVNDARQMVVGKALANFDGTSAKRSSTTVKVSGKEVVIGRLQVDISISRNPLYAGDQRVAGVPLFLSRFAKTVTDHEISAFRIYASLLIMMLCVIIAGIILFSGVRTGMVSIGRNPLAKRTIARNLIQVVLIALIIFVIGVIAVYLLLRV